MTKLKCFFAMVALLFTGFVFAQKPLARHQVTTVKIVDSINAGVQMRIERALELAKQEEYPVLYIELDTPGGYLEMTREIVQLFLQSEVPIIVHVSPEGARAASAGAMITMAAHYASMAPSTSIGAATPVSGDGKDINESMKAKVTNDTVAFVEGIANKRGRNAEFAKKTVTEAKSVTASEALELNAIDGVHENREEVWKAFVAKFPEKNFPEDASFNEIPMTTQEQAMSFLSNPNVAMGLMAIGGLGIYMEMMNPGLVVPGLIGVTAFALGAFSSKFIPIRTGAFVLLILGLILLGIEVLTPLPTYGTAGGGALVMFLLSGLFLIDTEQSTINLDPYLWIPIFITLCISVGLLTAYAIRALKMKVKSSSGAHGMEGRIATVQRVGEKSLTVTIYGELWEARSSEELSEFKEGEEVLITKQEGLKLTVSKNQKS